MSTSHIARNRFLHIRMLDDELAKIRENFSHSTKRYLSDYIRSVLLEKPVTFYTRNKSIDELLDEMISLRTTLHAMGKDFHESVNRLQLFSQIPEIRDWAQANEKSKDLFFRKMDEIENKIIEIDNKWLRS